MGCSQIHTLPEIAFEIFRKIVRKSGGMLAHWWYARICSSPSDREYRIPAISCSQGASAQTKRYGDPALASNMQAESNMLRYVQILNEKCQNVGL